MLHCLHHACITGTRQRAREVLHENFHFSTDGGRSTVCGTRASLMSLRTRSFEMLDGHGDHEIRDSFQNLGVTCDTLLNGAYDFDSGVKDFSVQTTFSVRSALFSEHFFCVLRGTQRTLTGVQPLVARCWPGYQWCHGIPTTLNQHCTAECRARSERCLLFKNDGWSANSSPVAGWRHHITALLLSPT